MRQFLGKLHSWSVCGWGIATAAKKLGHEVSLFSTDGVKNLPPSLRENLIGYVEENQTKVFGRLPDSKYDAQISYTCMKNYPHYFTSCNKNRLGIWVYEFFGKNALPIGFAKHHRSVDYICSPSVFGKQIYVDSGVPEEKVVVIPHGIDTDKYRLDTKISLPVKRDETFVLLSTVIQNHIRKNIPGLLDAYGKAFTDKDNVCLILKGKEKKITQGFEVSLADCIKEFKQKYPHHAELKMLPDFMEDMSPLYRSVDAVYSLSFGEGFLFPALEAISAGKLVIAPNKGGQVDFLNDSNSLLVDCKEGRVDPKAMYWEARPGAMWYRPSIDDAVDKLRYAYHNYETLNKKVEAQREQVLETYNWTTITKQFLALMQ
jgi:glycosyltransferase involved in cell wall biosynthesis